MISSSGKRNQRNDPIRFNDVAAGKPTYSRETNHCKLFYETTEVKLKSSIRNINHRNKTSVFDETEDERRDQNKNNGHYTAHKFTKKKISENTSGEIKKILQHEPFQVLSKKSGRRIYSDFKSGGIFSNESRDTGQKRSSKKTSSYSLNNNPYKWGIDVLRYTLPPPKRNYRHINNLSTCLVPNISADSFIPQKNKSHYMSQLEKSLCPKENAPIPNSSRKMIHYNETKLDINCVPKETEERKIKFKSSYHRDNLNNDLIPIEHSDRKPFHINTICKNKHCSIAFNYVREPSPIRSGKRIGYVTTKREDSIFFF
ncbi:hypothetical protein, conserved [Plasmodium gonderi]|uniref:Uncharacterized protein n=1 Tax=Plasmodium gonderi TaxID=77519 RepID=A0A1Y1JCG5_PLAGO|nr:hypothetical protein, conserved [Plasmodium gonderi]GAW79368.1 hypothetical protein, conserved [Plasmodium gonderi]